MTITRDQSDRETAMRGKYAPLYRHLSAHPGSEWRATFGKVEEILGFRLPGSARRHSAWWSNGRGHSHALAWHAAGWRTRAVNVAAETLVFVHREDAPGPSRVSVPRTRETFQPETPSPRPTVSRARIHGDTERSAGRPWKAPVAPVGAADRTLEAKRRVEDGLEALRAGLGPYVAKHMQDRYGTKWRRYASRARGSESGGELDVYALLKTLLDRRHDVFRHDEKLLKTQSFIWLAKNARNKAAHFAGTMASRETLRHLDAMCELLAAVGATPQVAIVERLYEAERMTYRDDGSE